MMSGGRGGSVERQARRAIVADTLRGPLDGLRVVELSDDTVRFAGKILAESGASVARIGRPSPGPAMSDPDVARRGGLLDWWFEGGKHWIEADLSTDEGV